MNYSALIKALRESMILLQKEFAKCLEVSFATVNRWEKGHHEPAYGAQRKIIALCKKYNMSLNTGMGDLKDGKR